MKKISSVKNLVIILRNGWEIPVRMEIKEADGIYIATECLGVLEDREVEDFTYAEDIFGQTNSFRTADVINIVSLPYDFNPEKFKGYYG